MLKPWTYLHLARITVQAITPVSIQAGQADLTYDTTLVRDANGLPALPATSIRGVLRHLYRQKFDINSSNQVFGSVSLDNKENEDNKGTSQTSRLQVSWGIIHNAQNTPVEAHIMRSGDDELLAFVRRSQPILRERVKLNHRGSHADEGKFDVAAAPTGSRFTFEIKYWSDKANDTTWNHLLSAMTHPAFRLGSNTRSGLGALEVIDKGIKARCFNLKERECIDAWQALGRSLDSKEGLFDVTHPPADKVPVEAQDQTLSITVKLTADDFIRFGGGDHTMLNNEFNQPHAQYMQSEPCIIWKGSQGSLSQRYPLVPASSIKGALAHRLLYHSNLKNNHFADQLEPEEQYQYVQREHNDTAIRLLGYAKNNDGAGAVGCLLIDDVYLDNQTSQQYSQLWHNRINRFTGGVIGTALFSEEVLFRPSFELHITVLQPDLLRQEDRLAFDATLTDLCNGLLPLGAGGSRGLGCCSGSLSYSGGASQTWLKTKEGI